MTSTLAERKTRREQRAVRKMVEGAVRVLAGDRVGSVSISALNYDLAIKPAFSAARMTSGMHFPTSAGFGGYVRFEKKKATP